MCPAHSTLVLSAPPQLLMLPMRRGIGFGTESMRATDNEPNPFPTLRIWRTRSASMLGKTSSTQSFWSGYSQPSHTIELRRVSAGALMTTSILFVITPFVIWLVSVVASAVIGSRKGNPIGATFLGLVLGPIGLIIVLLSGSANRKPCPYCAELIMKKAIVCPHCKRELQSGDRT